MFTKLAESSGNVVGFDASGKITKEDYKPLVDEVQALVDKYGSINLLLDLEHFKTEAFDAWGPDLRFGRTYHDKIAKLAIVGDKGWEHLLANLADPFYAHESKFFNVSDREAAWAWLRSS